MVTKYIPNLTETEIQQLRSAANQVWSECAYDILGQDGGPSSIPRSHVLEIVLDADRLWERIRREGKMSLAMAELMKDPYGNRPFMDWLKKDLTKNVFTYGRYGL